MTKSKFIFDEKTDLPAAAYRVERFSALSAASRDRLFELLNSVASEGFIFIAAIPGAETLLIFEKR
jgi:hypothetical protein